jgi:integral membrane protein
MLVFVYLIALGSVRRVDGWSLPRCAAAFAASLVPFGTFAFERWLARTDPRAPAG